MCQYRWLLYAALLVWPIGALRAQETKKPGDDASPPDAAAADVQDRQSPRQTTTRRDESKPDDGSKKPSDEGDSDAREDEIHFTGEIPDDLGEALSLALSHNPPLLVAEAKVREAQAEYDQVSLSVVHDVTVAFREYAHEKKSLEAINKSGRDVVPAKQIREQQENVERAKAKLLYMLGIDTRPEGKYVTVGKYVKVTVMPKHWKVGVAEAPRAPEAPPRGAGELAISRELQAALNDMTEFDFTEQPLSDVLDYLATRHELQFLKKGEGLPNSNLDMPVTANLKGVTVQAGLQALADLTQTSFVFRDYGILVICQPSEAEIYRENNAPMIAPTFLGRQPAGKPQREGDVRP